MVNYGSAQIPLSIYGSRSRRTWRPLRLHERPTKSSCAAVTLSCSTRCFFSWCRIPTGWWLNQPLWKICSSKWVHLPQFSGWKFKKYMSCHHPANSPQPSSPNYIPPPLQEIRPPVGILKESRWHPGRKVLVNLHPVYSHRIHGTIVYLSYNCQTNQPFMSCR